MSEGLFASRPMSPMRILVLCRTDCEGGADIAALRLVERLNSLPSIRAWMGVVYKRTSSPYVLDFRVRRTLPQKIRVRVLKVAQGFLIRRFRTTNLMLHSVNLYSEMDIRKINGFDCDLVHIHTSHLNTLSVRDISRINKALVWSLHDSWPCCGAEHHPNTIEGDKRYTEAYTRRNRPATTRGPDLCRLVWRQKYKYLRKKDIHFIAPSHWQRSVLQESLLFRNRPCPVIRNIIDEAIFHPYDRNAIRKILGIPLDKKVIGFGSSCPMDDTESLKGNRLLMEALNQIEHPEEYLLMLIGTVRESFTSKISVAAFCAGYVSNSRVEALLYNACDVFMVPSLLENLSNTLVQSISCGVPAVAFDVGGNGDIIEHGRNGYLARPFDTADFAHGISWCLDNAVSASTACLAKAHLEFSSDKVLDDTLALYRNIVVREDRKKKLP